METEILTHAELMSKRDGAVRFWRITDKSAKLVRDGKSFARIDSLTDGTFVTTYNGARAEVASWEAATAWLTMQLTAVALTCDVWM